MKKYINILIVFILLFMSCDNKEVDSYISWYNEKRIKMSLRAMSPLQYRRSLGLSS